MTKLALEAKSTIITIVTALITFQRGDYIRAKFTFELLPILTESNESTIPLKKKIQRLDIDFIT